MKIRMRNYAVIGEQPDGTVVTLTMRLPEKSFRLYDETFSTSALEAFKERHPDARIVKGGTGWSDPYDYETRPEK